MKKSLLLIAFAAILGTTMAYAQPRAIGGRLGYGIEFSYEHGFGEKNMLSVDAGFPGLFLNGIGIDGVVTYDWINPFGASFEKVWDGKGEWNWYMGVGAGVGAGFYHVPTYSYWDNRFNVGVAGRVGVEYNFWFPLQLSVDWRPVIGPGFYAEHAGEAVNRTVGFHTAGLWEGICAAVRYRF